MANSKITDLPEISSVESTDVLVIVDVSVDETKKIKVSELKSSLNLTKTDVGLSNVDNTSDVDKPVSTATQSALDLKADQTFLDSHILNNLNPHQVTKAQVGLSEVDNTSDADKPISTATQDALDLKANSTDVYTKVESDANYEPKNSNIQSHISNTSNPHNVTKSQVGLSNVDNTSDENKPISIAVQTALNLKENATNKGALNGYAPLVDGLIPALYLPSYVDQVVEVTDYALLPNPGEASIIYITLDDHKTYRWSGSTYTEVSPSDVNSVNGHTGIVVLTKTDIGLDQVENTSDADKPISTATQDALDLKANLADLSLKANVTDVYSKIESDANFEPKNANIQSHISSTLNPHSVTKEQVGLENVDNTSDANKPVSTATQTALNNIINEQFIPKQVVNPARCVAGSFPRLSNGQTSSTSGNLIAQQVILVPFFVNATVNINSWTVRAGSGGIATATPVQVGFYSHEDGLPTNLLHSSSITIPVLAGSTTSEQPISPVTLTRGVYWAAILNTSGATISLTEANYASGSSFDVLFGQLLGSSPAITSSVPRGFHTLVPIASNQLPANLVSRLVDFQFALASQSTLRIRTAAPIFYFAYTL
jgi:hypothetical protein